jgi:gas vesicle protein
MSENNAGIGFAIGFTAGIILGLSIAFVVTPHSGEKTREILKDKASDVSGRVRELTGNRKKLYTKSWLKQKDQQVKPYSQEY